MNADAGNLDDGINDTLNQVSAIIVTRDKGTRKWTENEVRV